MLQALAKDVMTPEDRASDTFALAVLQALRGALETGSACSAQAAGILLAQLHPSQRVLLALRRLLQVCGHSLFSGAFQAAEASAASEWSKTALQQLWSTAMGAVMPFLKRQLQSIRNLHCFGTSCVAPASTPICLQEEEGHVLLELLTEAGITDLITFCRNAKLAGSDDTGEHFESCRHLTAAGLCTAVC